jgi:hypothetical protein
MLWKLGPNYLAGRKNEEHTHKKKKPFLIFPPEQSGTVVPKLYSADPLLSATSSQGIRGYISVMVIFIFITL